MPSESWIFRVDVFPGESFSHFMGRFRRANDLSQKVVADHLGVSVKWVIAWESPSRRRNPTHLQQIALWKLTDVDPMQLAEMLPPEQLHLQTRLCGVCYAKVPIHRVIWQRTGWSECEACVLDFKKANRLLTACPACNAGFRSPSLWEEGVCAQCGLVFGLMQEYQKSGDRRREKD